MTYIEFFDKNAVENICTSLICPPERVVLVGDKQKLLENCAERYRQILQERGYQVAFDCRSISRNNLQNIVQVLSDLVEEYGDCHIDLTGGDELYLVAVGIVCERFPQRNIRIHRVNLFNNRVRDCGQEGQKQQKAENLHLSVRENIRIYGGDIIFDNQKENGTHLWEMSREFREDIKTLWEACKENVRLWNLQIGVLGAANSLAEGLTVEVAEEKIREALRERGGRFVWNEKLLKLLQDKGLFTRCSRADGAVLLVYKNEQVKRSLSKAGTALELWVYMAALDAQNEEGPVYNDVLNGVLIDWDGKTHSGTGSCDTENEVDIVMMHDCIPVFVSCKNGSIEKEELYKLQTVAEHFGGKYAKKVLIATALDNRESNADEYFRQRAEDMNIRLVEGLQEKTAKELQRIVASFWSN